MTPLYPGQTLHSRLSRALERAEEAGAISDTVADALREALMAGWPMISDDRPEQVAARLVAVKAFRLHGLH
jgi:hypothetical protein